MAKFPSQRMLTYDTGLMSNDAWTTPTSGSVQGQLNLPKDLSILNRRGYASTTRRGVPLVYRCSFKIYQQDINGKQAALDAIGETTPADGTVDSSADTIGDSDFSTSLRVLGCQNNWVMKNAAVKFHAAQRAMWKKAGVKTKHLGAYAHEIRYNYEGQGDTWLVPLDGAGSAFGGGTWDETILVTETDTTGFALKLVGTGVNETTSNTATALQIGHSYLMSRAVPPADSNLESSSIPAKFSMLNELLRPVSTSSIDDDVIVDAQDQGDNPPYDSYTGGNTNGDITEPVELGRCVAGQGPAYGTVLCDIPFGIGEVQVRHSGGSDQNIVDGVHFTCEVLDIFEMQG